MHSIDFIQDLAVILLVAGAVGWVCQRLGLSVVVGYLLAGILVGPYTPPFALVTDIAPVETLAQIGLIFLMFSIGLRLSIRKLRRLGFARLAGVFFSAVIIYYLTRLLGIAVGWTSRECLFLASMLMVSSSAIVGKILQETGVTHERTGQLAMGVSVLEDVVAVVMLTLLNSLLRFGGTEHAAIGQTLALFSAFVVLAGIAGLLLVPWLLRRLSMSAGEELQTLGIAAILFGLSILAQRAGYTLALGAFLLGTIVAETPHRTQVERTFEGMRDVFTAVFFVAMGMQLDIRLLADSLGIVAVVAVFTVFARVVGATVGQSLIGTGVREALRIGFSVTPIGEFSFIIAQIGVSAGVIPKSFYPVAVAASLFTAFVAPYLTQHSDGIANTVLAARPVWMQLWHTQYTSWLAYLQGRRKRNLLWQLSRKRFLQIGIEVLFVTGLLVFSEPLRDMVKQWLGRDWLFPNGPEILFWMTMTLVVLAPLVAIWRNLSALCLLFAQVVTTGGASSTRLAPMIENLFKVVAGVGLYVWLASIVPMTASARWVLLASLIAGLLALFLLKRKLVLWHSELEIGLQDVFRGGDRAVAETGAPWLREHGEWELTVMECVLPDLGDCRGKRIAELDLRSRFGCAIVGIGRQGYLIPLPTPDTVLYPRDKILLLGTGTQVRAGKNALTQVSGISSPLSEFDDVRMEAISVPSGSACAGKDLKTLSPAQQYHVQIAGVHRAGMRILNPAGDEVIESGDELLVLGTPENIRAFRDWLAETVPGA